MTSRGLNDVFLGRVRLESIRNKNNWNNASKRLFGSYSHSGITGFPFRLFCSQEQNSRNIFRNIFLFRNIPNERALSHLSCSLLRVTDSKYRESLDRFEKSKTLKLCLKNAFREFSSKILFRFSKNLTSSRNSQKTKIHLFTSLNMQKYQEN